MLLVNGESVEEDFVEECFSRIKTEEEQRIQGPCCERDPEFYAQAEQEVIDAILISQEAEKRYPVISEGELKPALKQMIDSYREHGASWDFLDGQRETMREELSASMRMDKLVADLLGGDVAVSDEEVRGFYDEVKGEYLTPAEARPLHFFKTLKEGVSHPELFREMCQFREEVLDGADFLELAERETEKSTDEIDLDWIPLDRPTNPFEATLFSLREGEVSPVIVYEHALHLIKVVGRKDEHQPSLEEVLEEVTQRALGRKKRVALQALAVELRDSAVIEKEGSRTN